MHIQVYLKSCTKIRLCLDHSYSILTCMQMLATAMRLHLLQPLLPSGEAPTCPHMTENLLTAMPKELEDAGANLSALVHFRCGAIAIKDQDNAQLQLQL